MASFFDRRHFLQMAGLGGASLFMPSALRANGSTAASTPPKRLLYVLSDLGPEIKNFRMKPAGAPDSLLRASAYHPDHNTLPDEATWEIYLRDHPRELWSHVLDPLYDLRDYVTALDGLYLATAHLDPYGDGHARGWLAASTGAPGAYAKTGQKSHASVPSIDMRVAQFMRQQDSSLTDLVVLPIRLTHWYTGATTNGFHYYVFGNDASGNVVRVPQEQSPSDVWDRLFGNSSGTSDPISLAQPNVMQYLTQRYADLRPKLSLADQQKLEQHRSLLTDLQRRIETLGDLSCPVPTRMERNNNFDETQRYNQILDAWVDLITATFACGTTRVASLQLPIPPYPLINGSPQHSDYHHWYSHGSDPAAEFENPGSEKYTTWADAHPVQANKTRHHASIVARLAQRFHDTLEDDGSRMLDNTLIVWVDEISHGSHGHDQWPAVLVGGNWAFRTGRYIRFARNNPQVANRNYGIQFMGQPHSQLLVSVCQAMGLPLEHFGVTSATGRVQSGPFNGMQKTLSLTGTLSALY